MKRILLALCILPLLAACGQKSTPKTDAEGAAAPPAQQRNEIAVIPKGLAHQFWLTVKAGAEAQGKELGYTVVWQGPAKETEIAKQINIVQDMISRRVKAIVLAACDENALVPTIQAALDANIPVITIDSGVKSDLPLSFVATDNIAGAKAAADALAKLTDGKGKVGLIPFVAGAATSELREDGFEEGLKAYPDMVLASKQYCNSDVAKAMSITQDMLTAIPDLVGIFAANEAAAIGAAQGLRAAGKVGQVKLVAFDAAEEEIAALKEGVIQALVVQSPFNMGKLGVQAAHDALQGNEVEKRIDTGVTVVTMENFNDPDIQKLLYPLQ